MSVSTVSITANPATRRRPVVATEKKSNNVELVSSEPQTNKFPDDNGTTTPVNGRDLSHNSISGEAVHHGNSTREAVQIKKTVPNSTVSPPLTRRSRKYSPPRPLWLTVLRLSAKYCVLLVLIVGLFKMVTTLASRSSDGYPIQAFSDFEGRIAEMDSFVKKTAKMMQVQVDVVDRKIHNEVEGLRREVSEKIDEKGAVLEGKLMELEGRSKGLESLVEELKAESWLFKKEFEKVYEEMKKGQSSVYGDGEVGLDDIRAYARDVVRKEIEKHAADGLGRVDYALASGGAEIVDHSEAFYNKGGSWFLASSRNEAHNANKMLTPSFGEPGHCFPLKGSNGFVQIRLRTTIVPEAITLDHVAKSVAYDRTSAPKNCRVSGWLQKQDMSINDDTEKRFLLAEFTYDLEKSTAQTFDVLDSASSVIVDTVRFDFTSNHGSLSHTCIYRLRVHGHEPDSVSMMAMQG